MPQVNINMWEEFLDETNERRLITALTDAVVSVFGEPIRPYTSVLVHGVPQRRWGTGGVPTSDQP